MKINSIEFKNYRCFKNAKFDFDSNGLNIVVGKNGSGKTELLYAIEWVLYGMDFSQLQGKTANPYSLNSDIYKNYTNPGYDVVNEASVTLIFTHPLVKKNIDGSEENVNTKFWLKKSELYTPNGINVPSQSIHSQLSIYDENGCKKPPIEDEKCAERIKKIIPRKVLSGLLFDGERMKSLSNDDENSRNTIDGFISEITNIELLSYTKNIVDAVKKEYSKDKTKLLKNHGYVDIAEKNENILKNEEAINKLEIDRAKNRSTQIDLENEMKQIDSKLRKYSEIKVEVARRESAEREKANLSKTYQTLLNNFQSELSVGYLLHCGELFQQINELVEKNDAPVGLTVEAARSILNMEKCICGEPWTNESRKKVEELISKLPPENLNTSVSQTVNSLENSTSVIRNDLKNAFIDIKNYNKSINDLDFRIAESSKIIGNSDVKEISKLEKDRIDCEKRLIDAKVKVMNNNNRIKELQDDNKKARDDIEKYTETSKDVKIITKKIDFVTKCVKIIESYMELNKKESLDIINKLISEAYKQISEEYELGKRIYITQFTEPKYKIVTYFEDKYNEIMNNANMPRLFNEYGLNLSDINDEEKKREVIILKSAENSSTGQRKILTLSFVKAVMEFATSKDVHSEYRTKKEYPLFIDAPFSELSGENLSKFAKELPNFNNQSIVMLDPDVYSDIKEYFKEHISKEYIISKNKGSNNTIVEEVL